MVQRGYRSDEWMRPPLLHNLIKEGRSQYDPSKLVTVDKSFRLDAVRPPNPNRRPVVSASLGPHVKDVVLPKPDLSCMFTAIDGLTYRLAREMAPLNEKTPFLKRLEEFAVKWLDANVKSLPSDTDVSLETWLEGTNYSEKRKAELKMKFKDMHGINPKIFEIKSFVKDEFYSEYKMARCINSRSDAYKCLVGPWVKVAESGLFSHPAFIKKVPVSDRPAAILSDVYRPGSKIYTTDFTSMESHFTEPLQNALDRVFFTHMLKNIAGGPEMVELMMKAKTSSQCIKAKHFTAHLKAKKMSGEMDTSCSNGFANLMFIEMMASECNVKILGVKVEGDDGVFSTTEPVSDAWFKENGLLVKLEEHVDISTASFCGLVFDVRDGTNVTDPRAAIAKFGWTDATYAFSKKSIHRSLLKCKALSLAYSYPACPLLTALARRILELTSRYDVVNFLKKYRTTSDTYKDQIVREAAQKYIEGNLIFREPGMATRALVHTLYGIPIDEQIRIEQYFSQLADVDQPLDDPILLSHMPDLWKQNFSRYACLVDKNDPNLDYDCHAFYPRVLPRSRLTCFVEEKNLVALSRLELECAD